MVWFKTSGFRYTVSPSSSSGLFSVVALRRGDPAALELQDQALHLPPQFTDGLNVVVSQLKALDRGLSGSCQLSWDHATRASSPMLPRRGVGPTLPSAASGREWGRVSHSHILRVSLSVCYRAHLSHTYTTPWLVRGRASSLECHSQSGDKLFHNRYWAGPAQYSNHTPNTNTASCSNPDPALSPGLGW